MGNQKKYELLENFDPRPAQYRGTAKDHLQPLLNKVQGKVYVYHYYMMKAAKQVAKLTYLWTLSSHQQGHYSKQ